MKNSITKFRGQYYFLSNFYPCQMLFNDIIYPSSEHAYVASKTDNETQKILISKIHDPGEVKKIGEKITLINNWSEIKIPIMRNILDVKFTIPELSEKLLMTGDYELIEGNTWGDKFWGQCPVGDGQNWLGKILMAIRNEKRMFD